MPAKVERAKLGELRSGQLADFFALLCEKTRRSTREGRPFYNVRFRDRDRVVGFPIWENSPFFEPCDQQWQVGHHFKIRGTYIVHERFGGQLELQNIRIAIADDSRDGYDPDDLIPASTFDCDKLFEELLDFARQIQDEPLQELVVTLLQDHKEAFCKFPGASHYHHAYRGGLLEHTVSVVRTGEYLADKYRTYYPDLEPPLNKDLILAGCILHDIGKIRELEYGDQGTTYTIPGHLLGHILQGRDLVHEYAAKIPDLRDELLLYLEHIIIAHQGTAEWGSPRVPMLPEAMLVHFADDIDAKLNMFVNSLKCDTCDNPFTDNHPALKRRILKKRTV